jgi:hypothetical protein
MLCLTKLLEAVTGYLELDLFSEFETRGIGSVFECSGIHVNPTQFLIILRFVTV